MAKLIQHEGNDPVNLDQVSSITLKPETKKIYFSFNAMNEDEWNDCTWTMKSGAKFKSVVSALGIEQI